MQSDSDRQTNKPNNSNHQKKTVNCDRFMTIPESGQKRIGDKIQSERGRERGKEDM